MCSVPVEGVFKVPTRIQKLMVVPMGGIKNQWEYDRVSP